MMTDTFHAGRHLGAKCLCCNKMTSSRVTHYPYAEDPFQRVKCSSMSHHINPHERCIEYYCNAGLAKPKSKGSTSKTVPRWFGMPKKLAYERSADQFLSLSCFQRHPNGYFVPHSRVASKKIWLFLASTSIHYVYLLVLLLLLRQFRLFIILFSLFRFHYFSKSIHRQLNIPQHCKDRISFFNPPPDDQNKENTEDTVMATTPSPQKMPALVSLVCSDIQHC